MLVRSGRRRGSRPYPRLVSFTVGFDLDMTLIDPRPGMVELFDVLAAETGVPLDGRAFITRLGPPLATEFTRYGCSEAQIEHLIDRYRALYREMVIPSTVALPGAVEAVRSVGDRGGRTMVVSAKLAAHVRAHLDALGIEVSVVAGELWSSGKASALIAEGAEVYVGDHIGDVEGARAADAIAVGVATGPMTAAELSAAGADVVLADLTAFPAWLDSYLLATVH
jgi:phosphoglycolate phosphatase